MRVSVPRAASSSDDFEVVAQVGAAIDVGAAAAALAAAENVAENIREGVGKAAGTAGAAGLRIDAGMAVLIVGRALLAVGKNFVGFLGFLEVFLRLGIVRIAVGMMLHGQLAIGLLDVLVGSVAVDAKNFVKVAFSHFDSLSVHVVQRPSQAAHCIRLNPAT